MLIEAKSCAEVDVIFDMVAQKESQLTLLFAYLISEERASACRALHGVQRFLNGM